ncbi:hypothetical protein FHS18_006641 [Paenibacillus phyllosphaerae]|uniref:Endo-1,4-beta-glucanase n=1 Tax=Paenibacillus phyllosphaerae TaxID=274593 RepID=A0A7W5FRH1_9BACL|nr:glycoside hydrolase family 44 protein [Paenibacillus phyllosphaerae]MBB3114520.1 hypothetical protein [Paenibacillus phyllosphaerae]
MNRIPSSRWGRVLLVAIACLLAISGLTPFGGIGQARAAMTVETSAQADSAVIAPGTTTTIHLQVTPSENASLLLDLELFNSSLTRIHQSVQDHIEVTAGEQKTVAFEWKVPAGLPAGTYIVSFGVFGAGWSGMHKWHAAAATITIGGTGTGGGSGGNGGGTGGDGGSEQPVTFESAAAITPVEVEQGAAATIQASIKASAAAAAVAEVRIVSPSGQVAASESYSRTFGSTATVLPLTWLTAADTAVGRYTVEVLLYSADRSKLLHENRSAGQLTVKAKAEAPAGGFVVSVENDGNPRTAAPSPGFEIKNTSTQPLKLSAIKLRYYFTIDGEQELSVDFWTMLGSKSLVTTKFEKMPIPSAKADYYLEIGFSEAAGSLAPGKQTGVYTWFHKPDWSSMDQTNDYSYSGASDPEPSQLVTAYVDGVLQWGSEPELLDMPAAPAGIKAVPTSSSVVFTWEPVDGADSYELLADGIAVKNITTAGYIDSYLSPGTPHKYKIRTRKGDAYSIWSAPIAVRTTGLTAIPAPVNVKAKTTSSTVTLSWNASPVKVSGYQLDIDGTMIDLPSTQLTYAHEGLASGTVHHYRVRGVDGADKGAWSDEVRANTTRQVTGAFDVAFTVDPEAGRAPISPYIYGANEDMTGTENFTARRMGGNRMSTYNWENNASNSGSDWIHHNDGFVPWYYGNIPEAQWKVPGIAAIGFHEQSLKKGAYSLVTLQTAGYAAADYNGTVRDSERAPSSRWVEVAPAKGAPLSLTPDLNDGKVYMDEFVNLLVNTFGPASSKTGIKGYAIDNEPGLWTETHNRMHPDQPLSVEILSKGVALAKAVKAVDPSSELFGPVLYGFSEYYDMQASTDWVQFKDSYDWYIDYYLDNMRKESEKSGKRLLDVLDLHWYPEISDASGTRVTNSASNDNIELNKLRLQAPRSLWDASFIENTWIGRWSSQFLPMIPRLQQSIGQYNPGTKLAFTEHNFGGENHITGGLAAADVLGIFGKFGVYLSTFWKMDNTLEEAPYVSAAYRLYNNYDGANGKYGDTLVKTETNDIENSSIYGSVFREDDGTLHLIVMNKNYDHTMNAKLDIAGSTSYTSARIFALGGDSPDVQEQAPIAGIEGNELNLAIPKLTAYHIVLSAE